MPARSRTSTKRSVVRSARQNSGLTREQLAVKAGVSSTTVYLAERAGLISETTAKKLASVLGVSPEELQR
jgi:transcriptional regulator with XRE-family HTH domain